jgi:hypothetical protein
MPTLLHSHEFFSQGILVTLVTGTGINLLELVNELSLDYKELYVFQTCTENTVVTSHSSYNPKIKSLIR